VSAEYGKRWIHGLHLLFAHLSWNRSGVQMSAQKYRIIANTGRNRWRNLAFPKSIATCMPTTVIHGEPSLFDLKRLPNRSWLGQ
jgi:hypothetical protein